MIKSGKRSRDDSDFRKRIISAWCKVRLVWWNALDWILWWFIPLDLEEIIKKPAEQWAWLQPNVQICPFLPCLKIYKCEARWKNSIHQCCIDYVYFYCLLWFSLHFPFSCVFFPSFLWICCLCENHNYNILLMLLLWVPELKY